MRSREIKVYIDLAAGKATATAWGCDLTYDYVKINSRYTT
jgi:N-acetylglutamate synthase/N-acetylornithine aminotransferase